MEFLGDLESPPDCKISTLLSRSLWSLVFGASTISRLTDLYWPFGEITLVWSNDSTLIVGLLSSSVELVFRELTTPLTKIFDFSILATFDSIYVYWDA